MLTMLLIVEKSEAVTPLTSSSKDNSNNMTAHNTRKESNSRNDSNSRTNSTVGMPTLAGMLAKLMKPATACRDDNNNMGTINMRWQ
jgi:hypothetical protein